MSKRQLITEEDIRSILRQGKGEIFLQRDALITPLAADLARHRNVRLTHLHPQEHDSVAGPVAQHVVVIGADHNGFTLKSVLLRHLVGLEIRVIDVGCESEQVCDFPQFAYAAAGMVVSGAAAFGIMIDGTGIGSAIAANKVAGIRAANCHDVLMARNAREHNNCNLLTLGGSIIGEAAALELVKVFLQTPYAGGRHQTRLQMIADIEHRTGVGEDR